MFIKVSYYSILYPFVAKHLCTKPLVLFRTFFIYQSNFIFGPVSILESPVRLHSPLQKSHVTFAVNLRDA